MHDVDGISQRDEGEFGSCSGRVYLFTVRYPPLFLYIISVGLLIYLLTGNINVASVNEVSAAVFFCFLAARTLRGSLHFLWRERGRRTFSRITAFTTLRAPSALGSRSAVYMILADIVLLPILFAFSAFHNVGVFRKIDNIIFYNTVSVWFGGTLGVISLLLSLIHGVVLLPMDRMDPYRFVGRMELIPRIIAPLSSFLGIPTLAIMTAAIPCEGEMMRFLGQHSCLSSLHRWCVGIAYVMLLFYSLLQDVALSSFARCGNARSDERRCDGLMLQLMLFHRLIYLLIASLARNPIWYLIAAFISALIFIKVMKTPFAASKVMDDLTKASLLLCFVSSFSCSLLLVFHPALTSWIWFSLWILSSGFLLAAFAYEYGLQIFESGDDIWVFDI
ncbi:uncharacterized protein TM35_000341510 [Trypanosoma theileri]|uniref:Uncharacterized protein n=1 Tax=Trypanosoma theileri TaxID=67003 RepID=A0A1X0NN35_9TRYP|nr:uncharacterized protein TM35_000341510 [Trypanosoma theileri]ORC85539.1 hypothetical protein TM35_000341510 [Trypanosoma theileri]